VREWRARPHRAVQPGATRAQKAPSAQAPLAASRRFPATTGALREPPPLEEGGGPGHSRRRELPRWNKGMRNAPGHHIEVAMETTTLWLGIIVSPNLLPYREGPWLSRPGNGLP